MSKFDSAKHKIGDRVIRQIKCLYEYLAYTNPKEVEIVKKTSSGLCYVKVDNVVEVYDRYGKGKGKNQGYMLLEKE